MTPHPDFAALELPVAQRLGGFHLEMLTAADLAEDFAAVTGARAVLHGLFGDSWPDGLTLEDNLTDLHWHHREFTAKRSFAWIIRDDTGAYLGCAYLFPAIGARGRGEAVFWMTDTPDRRALLEAFGALYQSWLGQVLPQPYTLTLRHNGTIQSARA